jgi:hypothetical protein
LPSAEISASGLCVTCPGFHRRRIRCGNGRRHGTGQDVGILHVSQFVRHHAFELPAVHQLQDARREYHRRMLGTASA